MRFVRAAQNDDTHFENALKTTKNTTKRTTFKSIKLKTNHGFTNSKSTAKQIRKKRQLDVKTSPCDFLI